MNGVVFAQKEASSVVVGWRRAKKVHSLPHARLAQQALLIPLALASSQGGARI